MRRVSSWVTVGLLLACVGGPASPAEAAKPEVVYVHDTGDPGRIFAYAKDRLGTLTALPGSPYDTNNPAYDCLTDCHSLAYSPEKRLLFAAGIKGISVFEVARNGVLGPIPGSPFGNAALAGVAVVTLGRRTLVYATEPAAYRIRGFVYQDRALVELDSSPYFVGSELIDICASPQGCLYVVTLGFDPLLGFQIKKSGQLRPDFRYPRLPHGLWGSCVIGPQGRFLYVGDLGRDKIYVFSISKQCSLKPVRGSPFNAGPVPTFTLALTRRQLVVIGQSRPVNAFAVFSRRRNGILKLSAAGVQSISAPKGPGKGALDAKGQFLVVTAPRDGLVLCYSLNRQTGQLTLVSQLAGVPFTTSALAGSVLMVRP